MIRYIFAVLGAALLLAPLPAQAFCGFYVAKADSKLFNKASKVILSHADQRNVITMANDFRGDVKDFAIVVPVPTVITEGQVHVAEGAVVDHLDAYTAPRLVEYFDEDPCQPMRLMEMKSMAAPSMAMADGAGRASAEALGVKIEAQYSVGEYDIVVLSAEQSGGLLTWLNQEGYKLPDGAKPILGSYIKQNMKFFLAKVNLDAFEKGGFSYLRPLQVAYESEKFMLPIRLGTLNADGAQDLILMTLTRQGRVETSNYRTVKIPSDQTIPLFVQKEFPEFYRAMYERAVEKEGGKAVFLEYAWDMGWCDPCAADPMSPEDLKTLGVWWMDTPQPMPGMGGPGMGGRFMPQPGPVNAFVTRLHVRYTAKDFPEDLMLNETADRENFQGRYVLQHPWTGGSSCEAGKQYFSQLPQRFETEAKTLANLTGWDIGEIRSKMEKGGQSFSSKPSDPRPWWDTMWGK